MRLHENKSVMDEEIHLSPATAFLLIKQTLVE